MCIKLLCLVVLLAAAPSSARPKLVKAKSWSSTPATGNPAASRDPFQCDADRLMVYRVTLATHWTRTLFPKQYPEWRPPAQWSKLVGRSHAGNYALFRAGQPASDGFKEFAETGRSDSLDAQSQGEGGIFDEFNAPPVTSGEGRTEAEFFVDSNHSRVSLAARIVPSPDWFIGLDSFNLCIDGQWVDSVAIKVGPMDAGTDNGFTFTSPNWPSTPAENIFRITSQLPNHPANSFYYPELKELPAIATFFFVKVKEYELAEIFDVATLPPPPTIQTTTESNATPTQELTTPTTTTSTAAAAAPAARSASGDDSDDDSGNQNNETVRKKSKKVKTGHIQQQGTSSALLKTLVAEYSRDDRAKKNRRGRKSAHLSKFEQPSSGRRKHRRAPPRSGNV